MSECRRTYLRALNTLLSTSLVQNGVRKGGVGRSNGGVRSNISTPDETCYACQMARPLRLEFSGAVYHVTSRGDRREEIFLNDADRIDWLEVLGIVCARFNWVVHAFCQMTNHYHLLLETSPC